MTPCDIRYLYYTIDGIGHTISMPLYSDYKLYFSSLRSKEPRDYAELLNNSLQRRYLDELITFIANQSIKSGDDARIAISIVQAIPYGYPGLSQGDILKHKHIQPRYPYEVVFDNCGLCGEKSILLALLLRELGYGSALIRFEEDEHMSVGIGSPRELSYLGSGYAFIETTGRSIVTDYKLNYRKCNCYGITSDKLRGTPKIIVVSGGRTFSCHREFLDAEDWERYKPCLDHFSETILQRLMIRYGL